MKYDFIPFRYHEIHIYRYVKHVENIWKSLFVENTPLLVTVLSVYFQLYIPVVKHYRLEDNVQLKRTNCCDSRLEDIVPLTRTNFLTRTVPLKRTNCFYFRLEDIVPLTRTYFWKRTYLLRIALTFDLKILFFWQEHISGRERICCDQTKSLYPHPQLIGLSWDWTIYSKIP